MFQERHLEEVGHAWNIVTIHGNHYPIDLTWDNTNFRAGQSKTYEFLGQDVKKFKASHIPDDGEPCKNYKLSEMSPEMIRRISSRFAIEKEYQSTTYTRNKKRWNKIFISTSGRC